MAVKMVCLCVSFKLHRIIQLFCLFAAIDFANKVVYGSENKRLQYIPITISQRAESKKGTMLAQGVSVSMPHHKILKCIDITGVC